MAIFTCSIKRISRGQGMSIVAEIAKYRACKLTDERLGKTFNFTKRHHPCESRLFLPEEREKEWQHYSQVWNAVEKSEKRKDKMHIFKVLMTSRKYGWTQESVHCLNIIDIVFSDDQKVRNAWKDLYDKYCVQNPDETQLKKIQNAQYKLLDTMASSLGYKDIVTWETIQNPYIPEGMRRQQQEQAASQQANNNILLNMQHMIPKNNKAEENNEH